MRIVAAHALRESLRRRVFLVVLILSAVFLLLYGWGANEAFDSVAGTGELFDVDAETVAGATILGLAMFAILFLGAILATFLTLGAVRGDAERGLLQPLLVRPLSRRQYLLARLLLLDEPTSGLDPAGRQIVRGLLEEVKARGIGVLLNSHLLSEV